jgi:hypothetical protein
MPDISEVRALTIHLHRLARADAAYTLYYDETNKTRRFLTYVGRADTDELLHDAEGLNGLQRANLAALNDLLEPSAEENPAFMHNIMAASDLERTRAFLEDYSCP